MKASISKIATFIFLLLFCGISEAQITSYPYFQNFDSGAGGWTATVTAGTIWELGVPTGTGSIGSYSAPNCWGTDLDSGYRANSQTFLTSPVFNIAGLVNPFFSFQQFRYMPSGLDGMRVEYSINNGVTWFTLGVSGDPNATNWYNSSSIFSTGQPGFTGTSSGWLLSTYKLNALAGQTNIKFRFTFNSSIGTSQLGILIDDVSLVDTIYNFNDIQLSAIVSPSGNVTNGTKQTVSITAVNFSPYDLDSISAGYSINGAPYIYKTYYGPFIASNAFILNLDSIIITNGQTIICGFAAAFNDINHLNDSTCTFYTGIPSTQLQQSIPYVDDFETPTNLWTVQTIGDPGTTWEHGAPNFGVTNSTHSGVAAWDINLNVGYTNNANTNLISPTFDFTGINNARLSFWQNRYSETSWDGLRIDYSTDNGISWAILGSVGDPNAINWYNEVSINSSSQAAWDGISGGWIKSIYKMGQFNNEPSVILRYVFTSDPSVTYDGVTIDDFSLQEQPPVDAFVQSITEPVNNLGAGITSNISALVANNGSQNLTTFSVSYSINNGTVHTSNFNTSILPDSSLNVSLIPFVVPSGIYNLCIWITALNDADHSNDTICTQLFGIPTETIPYFTNFDSGPVTFFAETAGASGTDWQLGTPNYGLTTGAHSGTTAWDINLNSPYSINAISYLNTPDFIFTGINNSILSFWQNRNTNSTIDGMYVEYSISGGVWTQLGTLNDPDGDNWYNDTLQFSNQPFFTGNSNGWVKSSYRLYAFNGMPDVRFRFVFVSGTFSALDGISIDDFRISFPSNYDAKMKSTGLISSVFNAGTLIPSLYLTVQNVGLLSFNNFAVSYQLNGGALTSVNYNGTVLPNSSAVVTLPGFTVPTGAFNLCAEVTLASDTISENDTLCNTLVGVPTIQPTYDDNFDNGNIGWNPVSEGTPGTDWQLGSPNYGQTNSSYSPPSCWDINLTTPYNIGALCYLYSPFFDMTNAVHPTFHFRQNRNTNQFYDGLRVDYFTNLNLIWNTLGTVADPNAINWYTDNSLISSSVSGWSGSSAGWKYCEYNLDALGTLTTLQLRFTFTSYPGVVGSVNDGASIDDFSLTTVYSLDAGVASIISPGPQAAAGSLTNVDVQLKNYGYSPITSLNIKYQLNGGSVVSQIWNGNLLPDSTTIVSLPSLVAVAGNNNLKVYSSWANDQYAPNDTIQENFFGILTAYPPYSENFDTGSLGWQVTASTFGGTTWQLGTPNYGATNSTHSGTDCWDINLTTPYNNIANTSLYSPIFNYTQSTSSELSFWLNYNSEIFQDGTILEYTTNGTVWNTLGVNNDPLGTNWFNGTILTNNKPGWSGNSQGWERSTYNTSFLDGNSYVQYRFRFISDLSLVGDGISMDDFSVTQTTGLNTHQSNSTISVYPNPVNQTLYINFATPSSNKPIIKIIDALGRDVLIPAIKHRTSNLMMIDVSNLNTGIYHLEIISDGQITSSQFVKE